MDIENFEQHIYSEYHTIAIRGSIHVVFLVVWSMKKLQDNLENIKISSNSSAHVKIFIQRMTIISMLGNTTLQFNSIHVATKLFSFSF